MRLLQTLHGKFLLMAGVAGIVALSTGIYSQNLIGSPHQNIEERSQNIKLSETLGFVQNVSGVCVGVLLASSWIVRPKRAQISM